MPQARPRAAAQRRLGAAAVSAAAHIAVLAVMVMVRPEVVTTAEVDPIPVYLVELPKPAEPEPTPPKPTPDPPREEPPPRKPRLTARPPVAPTDVKPIPAAPGPPRVGTVEVSESAVAGAGTAESGDLSGGACNMTRRLQAALRRDRLVQSAVADVHRGRAILVWNGDWVRHGEQEGAGLAAVREAILWEVGFAPPACRAERVSGLVVVTLKDGPGGARLALGGGNWRWQDLLASRRAGG